MWNVTAHSRGADRPSYVMSCPSNQRAQGMPGARCTRGLIRKWRRARMSIRAQRRHPDIPCVAALRLMPCSPRRRIRLVTVVDGFLRSFKPGRAWMITADLAPATGVRTTRFCRTLETSFVVARCRIAHEVQLALRPLARRRSRVHHIPHHVRDDRDTPLLAERDGRT